MKKSKLVLLSLGLAAVGILLFVLLAVEPDSDSRGTSLSVNLGDDAVRKGTAAHVKKPSRKPRAKKLSREEVKAAISAGLNFEKEEEARLSAEQKALIEEIRRVLEMEDAAELIRIVQRMQMSEEWPDGIPLAIRKAAIDALAFFGHGCIPEILGFVQDSDPEVRQMSLDAYEQAMFDANGDLELSQLVIAAAKTISDVDAMDMIMMSLNDMRPSRQVSTIKEIWKSGTETAKQVLSENMDFYIGEEGIDTPEKLDEWYNDPSGDNKDDEDAEEFYGPQKD